MEHSSLVVRLAAQESSNRKEIFNLFGINKALSNRSEDHATTLAAYLAAALSNKSFFCSRSLRKG